MNDYSIIKMKKYKDSTEDRKEGEKRTKKTHIHTKKGDRNYSKIITMLNENRLHFPTKRQEDYQIQALKS